MSAKNKRVLNQILGGYKIQDKLSRFEELNNASLPYLGVISLGVSSDLGLVLPSKNTRLSCSIHLDGHFLTLLVSFASSVPDLKLLDLTGNLISVWEVYYSVTLLVK